MADGNCHPPASALGSTSMLAAALALAAAMAASDMTAPLPPPCRGTAPASGWLPRRAIRGSPRLKRAISMRRRLTPQTRAWLERLVAASPLLTIEVFGQTARGPRPLRVRAAKPGPAPQAGGARPGRDPRRRDRRQGCRADAAARHRAARQGRPARPRRLPVRADFQRRRARADRRLTIAPTSAGRTIRAGAPPRRTSISTAII